MAVVGRPNVGKSTLVNALLGQKIAIVSPKPQTTRNRLLGILTREDAQIVFLDTPGIHTPLHKLGEVLVETAAAALPDADAVVWVVDVAARPNDEDRQVAARAGAADRRLPVILALNKSDRLLPEHVQENSAALRRVGAGGRNAAWSRPRAATTWSCCWQRSSPCCRSGRCSSRKTRSPTSRCASWRPSWCASRCC